MESGAVCYIKNRVNCVNTYYNMYLDPVSRSFSSTNLHYVNIIKILKIGLVLLNAHKLRWYLRQFDHFLVKSDDLSKKSNCVVFLLDTPFYITTYVHAQHTNI